ncbi:MAG: hypothetical protein U0176_21310 [Bacteroidia bacterium]
MKADAGQDLSPRRKQQLASGTMIVTAVLLMARGAWISLALKEVAPDLSGLMVTLHVAAVILAGFAAWACLRGRVLAYAGLGLTLLLGLSFYLPGHHILRFGSGLTALKVLLQLLPVSNTFLAISLVRSAHATVSAANSQPKPWWIRMGSRVLITLILLATLENALRQSRFLPGSTSYPWYFTYVDELVEYTPNLTDEFGIHHFRPETAQAIDSLLAIAPTAQGDADLTQKYFGEPKWLLAEQRRILRGDLDNDYTRYIQQLQSRPIDSLDPVERAYLHQLRHPLNNQGFRSIPFQNDSTSKTKVLLLGDSFTWGHSATHLSQSFADLLIARGFAVYNSGLSATDPAQYEAIARRYIPIIHPDAVVVNLYLGNDIMHFIRPIEPGKPLLYVTNAGVIQAYPAPEQIPSAAAAYEFARNEFRIPQGDTLPLNALCSKTVITTLIWQAASNARLIPFVRPNAAYWKRNDPKISKESVTITHLRAIQTICQENNAKFILAVIPDDPATPAAIHQQHGKIWEGLQAHIVPNLTPADYHPSDHHYNDQGHQKHADLLENALK